MVHIIKVNSKTINSKEKVNLLINKMILLLLDSLVMDMRMGIHGCSMLMVGNMRGL